MDEEEKQGKLHDTLQQVLSLESASHEALDSRIKGVTQGDDFSYRTIMTMINFTRTFGQADGMSMMLSQESSDKNESVSATLDHILAEVGALMERLQQLQAEGIKLGRVINE